jgi:uncharacterized protein (DUF1330 family)
MAAERRRHVMLVGVEVVDEAAYARYRDGATPILAAHGGCFGIDLTVARWLSSSGDGRPNRVFTLMFPERRTRDQFFADARYRAVRSAFFDAAVARMIVFGEYEEATSGVGDRA